MNSTCWTALMLATAFLATGDGDKPAKPPGSIAERSLTIIAEYESVQNKAYAEADKAKTPYEGWKLLGKLLPDQAAFSRRMVDLASTDPASKDARDALLWVLDKPGMGASGPYFDEFMRAVLILLRHHGDDPDVARIGLQLNNLCSASRDLFLYGVLVKAKGRESQGLARMALAEYLEMKSTFAAAMRKAKGPLTTRRIKTYDDSGKFVEQDFDVPSEDVAYRTHLRTSDPEAIGAEAKRLFEEAAKDFGEVPYVTRRDRALEALLKEKSPTWKGKALTAEDRARIEQMVARKKTLADVVSEHLDGMENVVVGKPAPAIEGVGMDGKPLKLSDYRGKVVVLVFWGTWCGPCMQEVPHEREIVKKYRDKPFAMLGIDSDGDKDAALKVMKDNGITWPNWNDGEPGDGPIVKTYHIRGYPTTYVLDAKGIIRYFNVQGSGLDNAVETLLKELEAKGASR